MKPSHYDLYLHPDMESGKFTGQEKITVNVLEATNQIILHSHKLQISNVYVLAFDGANLEVDNFYLDEVREFLVITMSQTLVAGTDIQLGIIFAGEMLGKIVGLYSSTYTTPDEEKR